MKQEFYSNGKLLITGEYVVLDGAKALALPTKKGQSLIVETNHSNTLEWNSLDCHDQSWYKTSIPVNLLLQKEAPKGSSKFDETLFKILWQAQQLNPNFLNNNTGYFVTTKLTFERLWGLGTSSTLINSIASWAIINPFELLNLSFGGSGYDIACAKNNTPIFYQRNTDKNNPIINSIEFNPPFKNRIFFVYLNKKKDSKEAITAYRNSEKNELNTVISEINSISESIQQCTNFHEFENLITLHETIISKVLKIPTIKKTLFSDYNGAIKSLGGWGGDFVMVTGTKIATEYFIQKGYTTVIPFEHMIL